MYELNPLTDERWSSFVEQHPDASIFHTTVWLRAISKTYGYEPVVFTTNNSANLKDGVAFCRIRSWVTGRRLVSLPFSDHCQPLASNEALAEILKGVKSAQRGSQQKYLEVRPRRVLDTTSIAPELNASAAYRLHSIDLRPEIKAIYQGFHESCIRRKIKRAEKEKLDCEVGRSDVLLAKFRHLLFLTRRRHKLPPQPASWFENIVEALGNRVTIYIASQNEVPVAGILTLRYKKTLIYKYGCSDTAYSNLGGTPLLFWKAIQEAKEYGCEELDLGRSDVDEPGLIAFKEHLGGSSTDLIYYRDSVQENKPSGSAWSKSVAAIMREGLVRLPDPMLAGVGSLLYRHVG